MEKLICPMCSGPMEPEDTASGSEIARCPYCGKIVELSAGGDRERVTETEEKEDQGNVHIRRTTRVIQRNINAGEGGAALPPDIADMIRDALQQAGASGGAGAAAGVKPRVVVASNVTVNGQPAGEIPLDVAKILQDAGIALTPDGQTANASADGGKVLMEKKGHFEVKVQKTIKLAEKSDPAKEGFFQRLFKGKKK